MIRHGIKYLGSFHAIWPLKYGQEDDIVARNPMLLYYYHNRLSGFHLEDAIQWDQESVLQAQERLHQPE
jgi:glycerol-3-phosphate O-acyltransferase